MEPDGGSAKPKPSSSGKGRRSEEAPAERPKPPAPEPDAKAPPVIPAASAGREVQIVPMTPIRRRIAERLVEAQNTAALLTTFNQADMSAVMALRKQHQEAFQARHGIKLGFMSFFVKASIEALRQIPQINAEVRGHDIVYRNYYDIGIAVGGGKGLVVPVLRNADRMSFADIEKAIADFAQRAQANQVKVDELQGGTFTISNGGIYGSMLSTPIVNPPQSGILGLHAIEDRPIAINGEVVVRPMMYLALTYDHRIVDGREAVTFLKRIKDVIENPARILLEI
jgi:2-oxoglutarate dehydrogenase E2 component (dihydrolipoamide succinyltransferase)